MITRLKVKPIGSAILGAALCFGGRDITCVNAAVRVDIFAEIAAVGDLSAVGFDLISIRVIHHAIPVDVAEEQPKLCADRGQAVALVVMHTCHCQSDKLGVAGDSGEPDAKLARIPWIDQKAAHVSAGSRDVVNRGEGIVKDEINRQIALGAAAAAFDSRSTSQGQIDRKFTLERVSRDQPEPGRLATVRRS